MIVFAVNAVSACIRQCLFPIATF